MTIIASDTEKLLTDKEVAALLGGVSRATVWGNVKKGIIPKPIKLGGITRFPLSDILGVIETAKQKRAA
ncbi:helix-turn-helix transcriptional regulator [Rhizobium hidalgonense]|uniref:helix-turn-helix transcriptional regulator n=1 Tax=Rhizobium hidalgonense TaxID=1538159 RepID=UPI002872468A|nr:helix-turn-helix domain-containing protein [Rhizobium hidalgonense]MDR9808204.1 helix-turn-helix domain-containing protein [Rhizobium hidalgonense]